MKGWRTVNFGQLIELWALSISAVSARGRGEWGAKADRRISFWHMCWRGMGGGEVGWYNYMTHVWGRLPARLRWVRNIFCTQVSQQKQFELSESFCIWVSEMHMEREGEGERGTVLLWLCIIHCDALENRLNWLRLCWKTHETYCFKFANEIQKIFYSKLSQQSSFECKINRSSLLFDHSNWTCDLWVLYYHFQEYFDQTGQSRTRTTETYNSSRFKPIANYRLVYKDYDIAENVGALCTKVIWVTLSDHIENWRRSRYFGAKYKSTRENNWFDILFWIGKLNNW